MTASTTRISVVGGGIVGLATARAILRDRPDVALTLFEKEATLAAHQTGRNSGVIHSGIYYKPGSHKALMCREGRQQLLEFCAEHSVPFEVCGKVIVATDEDEASRLPGLLERAAANGVKAEAIDRARLAELEPHVRARAAIHVHDTGIVDYVAMCEAMAAQLRGSGADVRLGARVEAIDERAGGAVVRTSSDEVEADLVVNCAGLFSDRLARSEDVRIVPFRGEYYELRPAAHHLVRNLVYPVPDPRFPFLGVHFTRMVHGGIHVGPNAVLALAREGYTWKDRDWREIRELATFPGMRKLAAKYWKPGLEEMWRSASKAAFVKAAQQLVPQVEEEDFVASPAGVRAQALRVDGTLEDDFVFSARGRTVHVVNAPSPAATASLEIGRHIAARSLEQLDA